MQFTQEFDPTTYRIVAHHAREVVVTRPLTANRSSGNDIPPLQKETVIGSCIITPQHLVRDWPPQRVAELLPTHLDQVLALQPEVILLGSGPRLQWPAVDLIKHCYAQGIGLEVMDTAAACRTYNILMYEGRSVAAALLLGG